MDASPPLQLGILAAALVLAGLAMLLQRKPVPIPDWPPTPRSSRYTRRDLLVTGSAVLLLLGGGTMAVLSVAIAAWMIIAGVA
jgi:hypothetical protein